MEISEYKNIFQNEKKHFFYVSTHYLIIELVKKYITRSNGSPRILDAGCGTGLLANKLSKLGKVLAVDLSTEAIKFSKSNGINAKRSGVEHLPFSEDYFDLVTSVDVLVSVKNDSDAFSEFFRVLKPGGILIIRVSSVKWLKLAHDRFVHSIRRYSEQELLKKINRSGLIVDRITHIHIPILLIAICRHLLESTRPRRSESGIDDVPKRVNSIANKILHFEARLVLSGLNLPFGMGLVAIARKPI